MILLMFIIYIIGVIVTSLILKKYFPEEIKSGTYEFGMVVEDSTDNKAVACLWPLCLLVLLALSPVLISKYILEYDSNKTKRRLDSKS